VDTLHVFYGSKLYVCLELGLWDRALEPLLEQCAAALAGSRLRKAACGCVWKAYDKGQEILRRDWMGRTVVVKE